MKFDFDDGPIDPPTGPLPPSLGQMIVQTLLVTAASAAGQILTQGVAEAVSSRMKRKRGKPHMVIEEEEQLEPNLFGIASSMKHYGHDDKSVAKALSAALNEEEVKGFFFKWYESDTDYEQMNAWLQIQERIKNNE